MLGEIVHLLVAHIAHLDWRTRIANVAPMAVIAAQPFAVAALVANKDVRFDVRPDH